MGNILDSYPQLLRSINLLESIEGLSRSYALMPKLTENDRSYLAQYKVEALDLTFEQFINELCELAGQQGVNIEPAKHTLRLRADQQRRVELSEEEYHYITQHFELLTEEILTQTGPEPVQFYRGYHAHWSFREGGKMLLMALYEVTDRSFRPFDEIVAEEFANLREADVKSEPWGKPHTLKDIWMILIFITNANVCFIMLLYILSDLCLAWFRTLKLKS